ncbi:hypothetical protein JR316_0001948 [Psilocybe cubensis]|uniref:Uncharacterized protein n=1 Tax=Psilocybe cubensis TaxID=181762 RepID=A0ACB8HBH8_PSICU|nr:hypothetical protein JR316_0001948 [Psilocybe cubensis]KAH9485042.1 hypothetical protein JR316_0001948 [Psilocybe cubensis]
MGKKNNKNNKAKGKPQSPSVKIPPTPISATQNTPVTSNGKKKTFADSQSNLGSPYHTPLTSPSTPTADLPSNDLVVQKSSDSAETQKHDASDRLPDPDTEAEQDHSQEQSNGEQSLGGISGPESNLEPGPKQETASDTGQAVFSPNDANQHQEDPIPPTLGDTEELLTEGKQEPSQQSHGDDVPREQVSAVLPKPDPDPEETLKWDSLNVKRVESPSGPGNSLNEHADTIEAPGLIEEQGMPEGQTEGRDNTYDSQTGYIEAFGPSPEVAGQTEVQVEAETLDTKSHSATTEDQTQAQHEAEGIRTGEELASVNTEAEDYRDANIQPEAVVESKAEVELQTGEDANVDPANAMAEASTNAQTEADPGINAKPDLVDEVKLVTEAQVDIEGQENHRTEDANSGSEFLTETGLQDVQCQSDNREDLVIGAADGRGEADGEAFKKAEVGAMIVASDLGAGLEDHAEILAGSEAKTEVVGETEEEEAGITTEGYPDVDTIDPKPQAEENGQDVSPEVPDAAGLANTAVGFQSETQPVSVTEISVDMKDTVEIEETLSAVGFDEHHQPMDEKKFEADRMEGELTESQGITAMRELEAENEVVADEELSSQETAVEGHAEEVVEHEDEVEMEVEADIEGGYEMRFTEDDEETENAINTDVHAAVKGQEVVEERAEAQFQANAAVEETHDEEDSDIQIEIEEAPSEECVADEVAASEALMGERVETPAHIVQNPPLPSSTDQSQEPSPTLSLSVDDVASKDILAIANVLANMKSALMSMSEAFGRLGDQVEGMVSLSVDIKAADQIRQLQVMFGNKIAKHKADIESLRIFLKSKIKEVVEEKIRSHLYELVKDSIQHRIEEKVRDQCYLREARHHNSLQTVPGPNARLRPLLRPLPTPEQSPIIHISRSSSLETSTLATPTTAFPQVPAPTPIKRVTSSSLRSALMPETVPPTPSVHFPRDLSALFALSQDETRRLLREYGLDSATSSPVRETVRPRGLSIVSEESTNAGHNNKFDLEEGSEAHAKDMNKLMSHFGVRSFYASYLLIGLSELKVPFLMIPGPKEKIDQAAPLSSRSRRKLLTPLIIK